MREKVKDTGKEGFKGKKKKHLQKGKRKESRKIREKKKELLHRTWKKRERVYLLKGRKQIKTGQKTRRG